MLCLFRLSILHVGENQQREDEQHSNRWLNEYHNKRHDKEQPKQRTAIRLLSYWRCLLLSLADVVHRRDASTRNAKACVRTFTTQSDASAFHACADTKTFFCLCSDELPETGRLTYGNGNPWDGGGKKYFGLLRVHRLRGALLSVAPVPTGVTLRELNESAAPL